MRHLLVQISDLHIKGENSHLSDKFSAVAKLVGDRSSSRGAEVIFLVTGDIAFSGQPSQYKVAEVEFKKLQDTLAKRSVSAKYIFAPGNHDCNFSHPSSETRALLVSGSAASLSRQNPSVSVIKTFLSVQESFAAFCESFGQTFSLDALVSTYDFESINLRINVLNTAWASELRENDNRPFVLSNIDKLEMLPGNLNITIHHHPTSWIDKTISQDFRRRVSERSDFVFTGHEHDSSTHERKYLDGDSQVYFESGEFHADNATGGEFRVIEIDTSANQFTVVDYYWDESQGAFEETVSHQIPTPSTTQANSRGVSISSKFARGLRDPGVTLKHSLKRDLELKDFFIFPRLTVDAEAIGDTSPMRFLTTETEALEALKRKKLSLITGDDKSGKSSLCKVLFEAFFSSGYVPLFINGTELHNPNEPMLRNLLVDKIKEQYGHAHPKALLQDGESKIVLIIDGFDLVPMDSKRVGAAVECMSNWAEHIIVTSDSSIEIQVLDDPRFGVSMSELNRLQIAPLNENQRKRLISKWKSIGSDTEFQETSTPIYQLEMLISSLMNEFGVPTYPLFVLTYLQNAEAESGMDLKLSSNAKLMEKLVEYALNGAPSTEISYQTKFAYLREFAFALFTSSKTRFSRDEVKSFHDAHCTKLDIDLTQKSIWSDLSQAKILVVEDDGTGSFKYSYLKTFFIAEYFKFNLSRPEIRASLESLVDDVHLVENANIIASLSVFASENWILEKLVSKLNGVLEKVGGKSHFELSDVIGEMTKIQNFNLLPAPARDEQANETPAATPAKSESEEVVHIAEGITNSVRLIKVIGQILRNSVNSLDGQLKRKTVEAVLGAASRIIGVQIAALLEEKDEVLNYVASKLREKHPNLAEPEVKEVAAKKLIALVFGSSIGLVDTVSRAIGDEFLHQTFQKVEEADKDHLFPMYLTAIKLDWYKGFPKTEVIRLYEEIEAKPFSALVLRYLAFRSLAFRRADISEPVLQQVSSKLKIDYARLQRRQLIAAKPARST